MKFVAERRYADPEAAARKLLAIANSVEAVQDGRIFADSDDLARVYRFDLAQDSDLMSPGARGVLAVWFLASAKPRGQS